jgi:hypothetical protein
MVTKSIREATTETEVFALLNAHIYEALSCGKFSVLPAKIGLPANDLADVCQRCSILSNELDLASRWLDARRSAMVKDALEVFAAARDRLTWLGLTAVPDQLSKVINKGGEVREPFAVR